jgi:hypothetical protein
VEGTSGAALSTVFVNRVGNAALTADHVSAWRAQASQFVRSLTLAVGRHPKNGEGEAGNKDQWSSRFGPPPGRSPPPE